MFLILSCAVYRAKSRFGLVLEPHTPHHQHHHAVPPTSNLPTSNIESLAALFDTRSAAPPPQNRTQTLGQTSKPPNFPSLPQNRAITITNPAPGRSSTATHCRTTHCDCRRTRDFTASPAADSPRPPSSLERRTSNLQISRAHPATTATNKHSLVQAPSIVLQTHACLICPHSASSDPPSVCRIQRP